MMTELDEALKKLEHPEKIHGSQASVMAPFVAEKLRGFCRQDGEFAQAVAQGGSFEQCMTAVAKGVGGAISDLDAYKRAAQFYFPGAEIRVQMTIDLVGDAGRIATEAGEHSSPLRSRNDAEKTGIILNLEDFL